MNEELQLYVMNGRAVLFALVLATAFSVCAPGSSLSDAGQIIAVSSPSGGLEVGKASTISIDLRNNAAPSSLENSDVSFGKGGQEALGIVAELQSREQGVTVVSGPQECGSLGPRENRSVEFAVRAEEDAGIGIHPMELALSYSVLSGIEATGEDGLPEMTFHYRDISRTVPLEVESSLGPKIDLQEVRGAIASGKEADLEVAFVNRGDSMADKLQAEIHPQEPFGCTVCAVEIGDLGPGEEGQARFTIFANNSNSNSDSDSQDGDYALPMGLRYLHEGEEREEDMAALVHVQASSWPKMSSTLMPVIALMLLLLASGIYLARGGSRKRGRRQKRRL